METWIIEINLVVMEKHEFEIRGETLSEAFFEVFEIFWFWRKDQNQWPP